MMAPQLEMGVLCGVEWTLDWELGELSSHFQPSHYLASDVMGKVTCEKKGLNHTLIKDPYTWWFYNALQYCPTELSAVVKWSASVLATLIAISHVATEPVMCGWCERRTEFFILFHFYQLKCK